MNIIMLAVVSVVFLAITAKSRAGEVALLGVVAATCLHFCRNRESPREQFPVEGITYRLAHEANAIGQDAALPLTSHVGGTGNRGSSTLRHHLLRRLHHRQRSDFEAANGFGVRRVTISFEEWNALAELKLPPPKPEPPYIHIPEVSRVKLHEWQTPTAAEGQLLPLDLGHPVKRNLSSLFSPGQFEFLEPEPIGYVNDLNRAVGFTSQPNSNADWQLVRFELIGLLKHEVPVAYVSEHLPQMDLLFPNIPIRPLDDFERIALERLRSYEDLVIDDTPNRIRMVGSLRAGKDCMECHSVRRGELLGAFSYELIGGRPIPVRGEPGA